MRTEYKKYCTLNNYEEWKAILKRNVTKIKSSSAAIITQTFRINSSRYIYTSRYMHVFTQYTQTPYHEIIER